MKIKSILCAAIALAAISPTVAHAQDSTPSEGSAPDGSPGFGFEPYFGVMGGYFQFDRDTLNEGIPTKPNNGKYEGGLVEGVIGANIPLGPIFIGAEGAVAKGFKGDIDWQYGVFGRAGVRVGDSGQFYAKAGYEWVNFDNRTPGNQDYGNEVYGLGVEVGPKDIGLGGITGNSGARLRLEINTRDFQQIRPMAGVVFHF